LIRGGILTVQCFKENDREPDSLAWRGDQGLLLSLKSEF
jgi:hypothetical protein